MATLYREILRHLKNRGLLFVDRFVPFFICSFGAHIFNLYNQEHKILWDKGELVSFRLPILFIAPPGFSKSLFLKHLLKPWGIFGNVGIPVKFSNYFTEAGLSGTFQKTPSGHVKKPGILEEYADGILGVEEYSVVLATMTQEHSKALDTAMLQFLADGYVSKDLGKGNLEYQTNCTLWAGTQFGRFDLSGGFGRRILIMSWVPTKREQEMLKDAMIKGMNIPLDEEELAGIHERIKELRKNLEIIKKVEFTEELYTVFRKSPHYEYPLYTRLILGYQIMNEDFDDTLYVHVEPKSEAESLINRAICWRREVLGFGAENVIIKILMRQKDRIMPRKKLLNELLVFNVSHKDALDMLNELTIRDAVRYVLPKSGKKKERWVKLV